MVSNQTSEKRTFDEVPCGRYFVWSRCPELGPLLKIDPRHGMDNSNAAYRIDGDEEVLL